jgi:signal transduction histidine kinase
MRLEIAEELHNDIGANLSAIALKSDLIRRVAREDIRGSAILGDIQRLTQDTMHQVREMIWVVREEHDTIQGLVTRMEDAAGTLLGGVVDYSLVVDPELPNAPLTMAVRQDVYRIFKEALQNVMKHAGECRVDITVLHREPDLVVRVSDDGCGFDESRVEPGNGLKLMRTRTRRQRIRVSVSSSPESGTRVEITARI